MPQETSPRDRREQKRETSEHVARWRGSPSYHGGPRSFHRPTEPRRPTGHGKQGDWHIHSKETGHRYIPYRSFNKAIPVRGDGRHSRGYRDDRGWREYRGGQSWETSRRPSFMTPKQSEDGDSMRDQHEKRSNANRLSPSQKVEEKRLVDSAEWKARRWMNPGNFPTRGSDLGHSSGSKRARGVELVEKKVEPQLKILMPLHSSTENVAECLYSTGQSEELTSKKQPRLAWGEGLAKYEKKKVEDPVEKLLDRGMQSDQSVRSDAIGRTSGVLGVLGSSSNATASSLALVHVTDMEDRSSETVKMVRQLDSVSDLSTSQSSTQGCSANPDKLDISSIASVDPSLVQLLRSNDISLDSTLLSTPMDDLVRMKENLSKALLMTETEIDSLENELRTIAFESENVCASPISSSFTVKDDARCSAGDDVTSIVSAPEPFLIPGNSCVEGLCCVKGTHCDSHVAAIFSKVIEEMHVVSQDASERTVVETVEVVSGSTKEDIVKPFEHVKFLGGAENSLCDLIFSSNKQAVSTASVEVFGNLLLGDHDKLVPVKISRWQDDLGIQEKFTQRKQFLIFKERVLSLKYKIFHHLWQKDMCVLSLSSRLKSQKKCESRLRIRIGGCQKPKSSIRPYSSSQGIMALVSSKETIRYTRKLVKDSCWRVCREDLKMPPLELDEWGRMASRFVSYNGLVEDPWAVEKERMLINPWTVEERETFLDKLGKYGKDFRKIATFLKHKTTADCVEFYYKSHKSDFFQRVRKKVGTTVRPELLPAKTYLVTSGKVRNCDGNIVSPDVLSGASLGTSLDQAKAGDSKLDRGSHHQKFLLRPCSKTRSLRIGTPDDERDAIAADVLTELRSSVVHFESSREKDLSHWTDEEKSIFMQAVSRYGKDFAMISQNVKTRSRDQCRAFYNKARKCLRLDLMLPGPVGKPPNCDANGRGDGEDGPIVVKTAAVISGNNSVTDMNRDFPVSVKMETADAIDCDLPADLKDALNGSRQMESCFCEEKGRRGSVKDNDMLSEIKLDEQASDGSLRASGRWLAPLPADSSPCSVFSVGSESKDQSPVETDQVEKPQRAINTDCASFQFVEMKIPDRYHPESRGQLSHDSEGEVDNQQELGKSSHGRDFKLFGKRILACTPSQRSPDLNIHKEEKKGVLKFIPNFSCSSNEGLNSSLQKFDPDDHTGLENVPIWSYGYWDGTSVISVPSLPDSTFLLAKYPAAFSKHPQEVARSSLANFNNSVGPSIIPAWDVTVRQRHDAYLQMQRCNGLEAISGLKQHRGGRIDGLKSGARGVLAGGPCTDLSDPVAAVKMHYASVNQFWGPGVRLTREDSQRDAAGMKT